MKNTRDDSSGVMQFSSFLMALGLIFHFFGYHHKGALSVQAAQQSKGIYYNDSWRRIKYAGDLKKSLWKFIGKFPTPQ